MTMAANKQSYLPQLHSWSIGYKRYDCQLDDPRLSKFQQALINGKPIMFKGEKFQIIVITMTQARTEVLLKVLSD